MNLDSRREIGQRERQHIQILADAAVAHANEFDLDKYPNLHISRALRGVPEGRERDRLFGQIKTELKRRGFKSPQELARQERQMLRDARQQILLEDAYKHEARIDPHEMDEKKEI